MRIPFGSTDFARILHNMVYPRARIVIKKIRSFRTRAELDMEPSDPWNDIARLFNDESFKPQPVPANINGVIQHHISAVDGSVVIRERTPDVLKAKWGKLKSDYGSAVKRFKQNGFVPKFCKIR